MGKDTAISWADHTFNPWIGCTKVSPGCANCYAATDTFARVKRGQGVELWGNGKPRHRTSADYWKDPVKWNKAANVAFHMKQMGGHKPSMMPPIPDDLAIREWPKGGAL